MKKSNSEFIEMPYNAETEKAVLSCLVKSSEAIELARRTLSINAFYVRTHQELYRAILLMDDKKLAIDYLTLLDFLESNRLLTKIGGVSAINDLYNKVTISAHLEDYLSLLKEKFIRRSLIKLGYRTVDLGYMADDPLDTGIQDLEQSLFNLSSETKPQKLLTTAELLNQMMADIKKKSLNPGLSIVPSGFFDLDGIIQGFQRSDLIIIAGRPSMGKTALGLNIGLNTIKKQQLPVLFFSLEMSKEQIMYRLLSMETGINQIRIKSGKLFDNDWARITEIAQIFAKIPLFLDDSFNLSIQTIRSKIKSVIFEHGDIGLIIIDYLQLMQNSTNKFQNRAQELSQITRSLKTIAREFNVPIIALSQLNRTVETRIDKKPILSDLRESGSIEQDADLVLMIHKIQNHKLNQLDKNLLQVTDIIIAKNRNGPVGTIQLKFDMKRTKFSDSKDHKFFN